MRLLEGRGKIDKSDMLGVVGDTPQMIKEAVKLADLSNLKIPQAVFVSGMGGSAVGGDLVLNLLSDQLKVPMFVNRNYILPGFFARGSLFIASSYSGETEETLSALKEAEKAGAQVVCLTSGGKLKEIAEAKKYPLIEIKKGLQPRAALPYFFISILKILERAGLAGDFSAAIEESIEITSKLRDECGPLGSERSNQAIQMAQRLHLKIPVIFSSAGTTEAVGRRLKNQLNENAKVNALLCVFPELNHNEMVGLAQLKRGEHVFAALFLRDEEDHARINKRIEITKSLLGAKMGGIMEMPSFGKSRLARMFSQIMFADYLSVYLAILSGVDPTPVEVIERFKKEMAR